MKATTLLVSFKVIKGNCVQTFFHYIIEFRLLYIINNYCNDYFGNNNTDAIMSCLITR